MRDGEGVAIEGGFGVAARMLLLKDGLARRWCGDWRRIWRDGEGVAIEGGFGVTARMLLLKDRLARRWCCD